MDHNFLIDSLGGTTAVAKLLSIKPPSVHRWRKCGIPDDKLIRLAPILERAGIASRKQLFLDAVDIWPEIEQTADHLSTALEA